MQGVNFSRDVVVGGEEKASRVYLGDIWSANSCPLVFCASDRWCSNYELESSAYIERESVTWCYDEGYFKRERYGDRKIELFDVGRSYAELRERVNRERVNNYSEYVPWFEADVAEVGDDVINDDFITYLVGTDNTKGDRTIIDRDKLYEIMIWSDHIDYNSIVETYKKLNEYYIDSTNILYSIINNLYRPKIRWLFDDGG